MSRERRVKINKSNSRKRSRNLRLTANIEVSDAVKNRMKTRGREGEISFEIVTVSRGSRRHILGLVLKSFRRPITPVEEQYTTLHGLKKIPSLAPHIPTTIRLVETPKGLHPSLLLTDLTSNGRFLIENIDYRFSNKAEVMAEVKRLEALLDQHQYYIGHIQSGVHLSMRDPFLVQVDPLTKKGIKVWIVDAGNLHKR